MRSVVLVIFLILMLPCSALTASQNEAGASFGRLDLTVDAGGGRLTIDGNFVAELKAFARYQSSPLRPGRHTIRLEKEGYAPVELELVVRPNVATERKVQQALVGQSGRTNGSTPAASVPTSITVDAGEGIDVDLGVKDARGGDLMWAVLADSRYLIAQRGAKLAMIGGLPFESIALDTLKTRSFSLSSISTGAASGNLSPGTVVGVLTSRGAYAKIRIDRIMPSLMVTIVTFK